MHGSPEPERFEVFFDGACPLCRREIELLRKLDDAGRIRTTDIAAADFDPRAVGVDQHTLMNSIHGRLPNGEWVRGVEVFRQLYERVGFGRAVAVSRWPLVTQSLDVLYRLFAKHRLRLTGRCNDVSCGTA